MMQRIILAAILGISLLSYAGDSVWTEPARPAAGDSITFNLFTLDVCCCAVYHKDTAAMQDTLIVLSSSIDKDPCMLCNCFAAGSWHQYRTGPVTAGTYAIYKAHIPWCGEAEACLPMIDYGRVGEITVEAATSSAPAARHRAPGDAITIDFFPRKHMLAVTFSIPVVAGISVYAADGRVLSRLESEKAFLPGLYYYRIDGADIAEGLRIIRVTSSQTSSSKAVIYEK